MGAIYIEMLDLSSIPHVEHAMPDQADPRLLELLQAARKILVFAGAGISTNSGIPDYRGPQGIWKQRDPVTYQEFMASEQARLTYWKNKRDEWLACRDAEPNEVHRAIVALEKKQKLHLCVTQNIDGLHQQAGTSSRLLVELHGTNMKVECQNCHTLSWPEPHFEYVEKHNQPPNCRKCHGFLKSATISFGQSLRQADLEKALRASMECDLVIALGSTLAVYPAASIPLLAAEQGVPYVIINRGETDHDALPEVTLRLDGDVTELFTPAVDMLV